MLSEAQITLIAAEARVPRSVVNAVVYQLGRRGDRFTGADAMAGVLEVEHPAVSGWRVRPASGGAGGR